MARPILQGAGAISANTSGNLSPTIPTHAANDILVARVVLWSPVTGADVNDIPTPSGWTLMNSQGGGGDGRHGIFWRRATGAGTTVTFTRGANWDTGNDTVYSARVFVIRNCRTSGDPHDSITTQGTESSANAAVLAQTAYADRLQMFFMGVTDDIAAPTLSGYTVDWATTATGTQAAVGVIYKDVDSNQSSGNMTSSAPAQGNYVHYQVVFRPASVSGAVASPLTVNRTVAGILYRRGVVNSAFTVSIFTHAFNTVFAAVSQVFTVNRYTFGSKGVFAAFAMAMTLDRVTSGEYTRRGVVNSPLSVNVSTHGTAQFYAAVSMALGLEISSDWTLKPVLAALDDLIESLSAAIEDGLELTLISEGGETLTLTTEDALTLEDQGSEDSLSLDPL